MSILAILGVIFLMAFLVEAMSEYFFGLLCDHIKTLLPYKWLTAYIAAAVGVTGAFIYKFDLLSLLGAYLGTAIAVTWFGILLTGLAIGRGSNFLHDLLRFFTKPTLPAADPQTAYAEKARAVMQSDTDKASEMASRL